MAKPIIIQAALVIPRIRVEANVWNSGWSSTTMRLPCVAMAPMPPTTNDIASVPIRGLIRNFVTTTPLATPTARPTQARRGSRPVARMKRRAGRPWPRQARTGPRPTGRSRRRSAPGCRHAATMMIPDCWSRMLARFWNRRNGGLISARTTNTMTNGIRMPPRPTAQRARPSQVRAVAPDSSAPARSRRAPITRPPPGACRRLPP